MAAYTTPAAVRAVLTRDDSDPIGTAAGLQDYKIQAEIDAAQAEVDARLAGRYTCPFTNVPPLVATITRDLAAYRSNLLYRQSEDLTAEDPMVLRYQAAQTLLALLSKGDADLPGVGQGDGNSTAGSVTVHNPYSGKLFTPRDWGLGYDPSRQGSRSTYGGWRG